MSEGHKVLRVRDDLLLALAVEWATGQFSD